MKIKPMLLCGLFAALMAICAWIYIPFGAVGLTMQTFAVALSLCLLGGKWGTVSILVYLLLGTVGVPVFSGFRGGIGVLLGASGGYLFGFLAFGLAYWLLTALLRKKRWARMAGLVAGLLLCYGVGTAWYMGVYAPGTAFAPVLLHSVVPYLVPDVLKLMVAAPLAERLRRFL